MAEKVAFQKAAYDAAAAIANPSSDSAKALAATAATAVVNSPELREAISSQSRALLGSLSGAATTIMSQVDVGRLAGAAGKSPAAFAGEMGMQAVGIVIGMAPMIAQSITGAALIGTSAAAAGAVAAAYAAMIAIAAPLNAALAEQAEARAARYYEGMKLLDDTARTRMRPRPTGPRGENRPADLFPYQSWKGIGPVFAMSKCADTLYRPLIGAALMRLTESGLDTAPVRPNSGIGPEPEWDPERPAKCAVKSGMISATYYPMVVTAIRNKNKDQALGITEDRRKVFRMLRRAIQAQWNVPGTDGGASLWPAYMDLLVREFDDGHLTPEAVADFMAAHIDWDYNDPSKKSVSFSNQTTGWQVAASAINTLVDNWRKTVNPIYAQDVAARAEATKLFVALAKVAALKNAGVTRVPAALLKDIPAELQKQIGVMVRPSFAFAGEAERIAAMRAQGLSTAEIQKRLQADRAGGGTSPIVGAVAVLALGSAIVWAINRKKGS